MTRRSMVLCLLSLCAGFQVACRQALAWRLIMEEEALAESKVPPPEAAAPLPNTGAPQIEVIAPDASKPIRTPVSILIKFHAQAGATIDPKTFRAKYGWLGIDITDRIVGHAKIDASGLAADDAEVSPGQYMVRLEIADNLGRIGTRSINFKVV